jgi:DNA-binding CsgD family transcriptional regulator
VKTYKKRLFKKLGVSSISEALIYAINNRLL